MYFKSPLTEAILLKRYYCYLADVVVTMQDRRTIYCPNVGSLHGCDLLGSRVWFSSTTVSQDLCANILELVEVDEGYLVDINMHRVIDLLEEAIANKQIPELLGYLSVVKKGTISGISHHYHFVMQDEISTCVVETYGVTMGDEIRRGFFPSDVVEKHTQSLEALIKAKSLGCRAVLFLCVQHTGVNCVHPAFHIDQKFCRLLATAYHMGVEIIAYRSQISSKEIYLSTKIPVALSNQHWLGLNDGNSQINKTP